MKENILNNKFCNYRSKSSRFVKLFALGCLLLLFSCKAKKQLAAKKVVAGTPANPVIDSKMVKLNAIKADQMVFNTFSGKARAMLDINGSSNDVTLYIRIKNNQKIWVSVTAIAGIEVARALITPDSVLLINRLENHYVKQPFSYISKFAGDQVNYNTIESLLVGNAIPELLTENSDIQTENGFTVLSGNLAGLLYKVVAGPDLKVNQTDLNDQPGGQSLQVTNSAFVRPDNKLMPSQIAISSVVKNKKIQVNLRYVKEDFDQALEFPFNIPSRYTPSE